MSKQMSKQDMIMKKQDIVGYRTPLDAARRYKLEKEQVLKVADDGSIALVELKGDAKDGSKITLKADQISLKGATIDLEGDSITIESSNFNVASDGTAEMTNAIINGGTITLSDGASVVGDNGLLTQKTFPFNNVTYMFIGGNSYMPLGYFGYNGARSYSFATISIPNTFTVAGAKLFVYHTPITWSNAGQEETTGYIRTLNLYKTTIGGLNIDITGLFEYSTSLTNTSKLNWSPGNATASTSVDITSLFNTTGAAQTLNLALATSDTTTRSTFAARAARTGGIYAYVEVYGYTNWQPSE